MATTTTTNIKLVKPDYSEVANVQVLNGNADKIDAAFGETYNDLGIVANGSTAPQNITAGQYVIWMGALYTASANIATGATLSSSNLTAVSGGGLNALNNMLIPVAVMFTPVSGVSIDLGGAYQIGQMVYVDMRVHLETAIINGVVGRLAKVPKSGYYANNYVPIAANIFNESATSVAGYIDNNGGLSIYSNGSLTPPAGYYSVVAMYIAD